MIDRAGLLTVRRRARPAGRDERGATIVEFAVVSIVLFALFFGMVGLCLVEIGDSVGTNGAREGARQASLSYLCADAQSPGGTAYTGCSANSGPGDAYTAIRAAAVTRLVGLVATPQVTVQCLDGSTTLQTPKRCDQSITPVVDLVRVTLRWTQLWPTPFVATTHSSSATVQIVGRAPTTAPPPACQVTSSAFGLGANNPNPVTIAGGATSGPLVQAVAVTANTSEGCDGLYLSYRNSSGTVTSAPIAMLGTEPSFSLTLAASLVWTADTYSITFTDGAGATLPSIAPALRIVVSSAASCTVTASSVAPSAARLANGATTQGYLADPEAIGVTTNGSCPSLIASFDTGVSQVGGLAMTPVAGGFSLTVGASAYAWTTGVKVVSFSMAGGPVAGTATLSVSAGCALRFEVDGPLGAPVAGVRVTGSKSGTLASSLTLKATPTVSGCFAAVSFGFTTGNTHVVTVVNQAAGVYQLAVPANAYVWSVGTVAFVLTYASGPITPNPTQVLIVCRSNARTCP